MTALPPLPPEVTPGSGMNGVASELSSLALPDLPVIRRNLAPEDFEREQLLDRVEQDRNALVSVAHDLRGPVETLKMARNTLVFTGRSIRWIAFAGNLAAVVMWLRSGRRRPPLVPLVGVSLELLNAWSNLTKSEKQQGGLPPP
ncbi:MAG: hypothetical protein ACT4PZ_13805 [Panacagrimonas sp.]